MKIKIQSYINRSIYDAWFDYDRLKPGAMFTFQEGQTWTFLSLENSALNLLRVGGMNWRDHIRGLILVNGHIEEYVSSRIDETGEHWDDRDVMLHELKS